MIVYAVMMNRGDGEGDRLIELFDSIETAEAYIKLQDYPHWYDWYSYKVLTKADIENKD